MKKLLVTLTVAVTLTALALTALAVGSTPTAFSDVRIHKYRTAIEFIASRDIVSGYPDGTFKPNNPVKRGELLRIVMEQNYPDLELKDCFTDVKKDLWFSKYACKALEVGIVQGYPDGSFKGGQDVNFVEALKIMQLAYDLEFTVSTDGPWYKKSVNDASAMNIIPLDTFAFGQKYTRGQMAEMLTRLIKSKDGTLSEYLGQEKDRIMTFDKIDSRSKNLSEDEWMAEVGELAFSYNPDAVENFIIPPNRLMPFTSAAKTRELICALSAGGPIEEICAARYASLTLKDSAKIDELLLKLREVYEDGAPSGLAKHLTAQLVFATIPQGAVRKLTAPLRVDSMTLSPVAMTSSLVAQSGGTPTVLRADFDAQLAEDIKNISDNCPEPGYENWSFSAMCSEYRWVNGAEEPIYSTQYAESGGPCVFNEAGAIEGYHVKSIVETKMKSEYNFTNEQGVSSQIACSFSCGSYKCPKLDEEIGKKKMCENPIYHPYVGYGSYRVTDIPARQRELAYESMESECDERGYNYPRMSDGSIGRVKVRDCKLEPGTNTFDLRQDPPDYTPTMTQSVCCSCSRPRDRLPYASYNDFSKNGFPGDDILQRLLDFITAKSDDELPRPPVDDNTPETPDDTTPRLPDTDAVTPAAGPATTVDDNEIPPAATVLYKFSCKYTSGQYPGFPAGVMEKRIDVRTGPLDENGDITYYPQPDGTQVNAGGSGGGNGMCTGPGDKLPQCYDPRTGQAVEANVEFTKSYPLSQYTIAQINTESLAWFQTMTSTKRDCTPAEYAWNAGNY